MYACMHACVYVCLYACMYVRMYVFTCTNMYICIHIYITHTYVHIYSFIHTIQLHGDFEFLAIKSKVLQAIVDQAGHDLIVRRPLQLVCELPVEAPDVVVQKACVLFQCRGAPNVPIESLEAQDKGYHSSR